MLALICSIFITCNPYNYIRDCMLENVRFHVMSLEYVKSSLASITDEKSGYSNILRRTRTKVASQLTHRHHHDLTQFVFQLG